MTSGTVDQTLIMQEIRKRTLFSKIREKTYFFQDEEIVYAGKSTALFLFDSCGDCKYTSDIPN